MRIGHNQSTQEYHSSEQPLFSPFFPHCNRCSFPPCFPPWFVGALCCTTQVNRRLWPWPSSSFRQTSESDWRSSSRSPTASYAATPSDVYTFDINRYWMWTCILMHINLYIIWWYYITITIHIYLTSYSIHTLYAYPYIFWFTQIYVWWPFSNRPLQFCAPGRLVERRRPGPARHHGLRVVEWELAVASAEPHGRESDITGRMCRKNIWKWG